MRCLSGVLAVGLLTAWGAAAEAGFYVSADARAITSGNILNGDFERVTFTQVPGRSVIAGPATASSTGTHYGFAADAWSEVEVGAIHAYATASATSTGPAGGGTADAYGLWSDTITITSDSLARGTLVEFLATVILHRDVTATGSSTFQSGQAYAQLTGPFGLSLYDSSSAPNATQSVSTVVRTTVGSTLSAWSSLSIYASASGSKAPFGAGASVLAQNTARFEFTPITAGASYETESGARFETPTVPEPGTLALMGLGGFGMAAGAWRKKRKAALAA